MFAAVANKVILAIPAAAVLAVAGASVPAAGQHSGPAALSHIDAGRWELRLREAGAPVERICVRDGRRLIQLRHAQQQCERFIVTDEPLSVTVQYTCRGKGYGRTQIRRESNRLVQIETQGIAEGLPFNFAAEARWVAGDCQG